MKIRQSTFTDKTTVGYYANKFETMEDFFNAVDWYALKHNDKLKSFFDITLHYLQTDKRD